MSKPKKITADEVLKKYGAKIEGQINSEKDYSKSYSTFKEEISNEYSKYEKLCISVGNVIKTNPSKKDLKKVKKSLDIAHSNIEPWQALNLAVMSFVLVFLFGLIFSIGVALVKGGVDSFPLLFFFLVVVISIFLFYFLSQYPDRLAAKWRLKASNQMVPAILYIVVYMRHTPNLEKAIAFASQHLGGALAFDLKKVFYNVEIGKYSTIKESLDAYLENWRDYSSEFVEAFHLIESSLFEPNEGRRIASLEKSLQVVLEGVYEKMLKFSHSVRSPITNVYMLGVVLPTLGLALIPLASAMIGGLLKASHVFLIFNLIVPFMVFYLTDKVLMMRPGGYGESNLIEKNPLYPKYKSNAGYKKGFLVALPFLLLGLLPLLWGFTPLHNAFGLQQDFSFKQIGINFLDGNFFGFIEDGGKIKGPFGTGALFLGMLFPIGLALLFSIAYREKTKDLIVERQKTKDLEKEFNNSLFQLGNRLGNGVPPELVFGRVAQSTKGLKTGDFFSKVNYNIRQMGMSVEKAIFDKNRGAIKYYPSDLIATSMRVLIESSKKGLKIAAVSLMSISEYVKNINKITMRLRDLLAEISSDMKSNMTFLAPLLSGIVVGLASMITAILGKFQLDSLGAEGSAGLGGIGSVLNIFDYSSMIPPYFLQISVGIYLIQIVFILTSTLVTVDSGEDKLEQINKTGLNLKKGMTLYFITALLATLVLSILSATVLGNLI